MNHVLLVADQVLRSDLTWPTAGRRITALWPEVVCALACALLYGAVMGTFGGEAGARLLQVAFSAAKVPLLLGGTFLISLPSFFVLNTLLGLRSDFVLAVRALVAAQTALTLVLASLAPYTALWYLSFQHYPLAVLFNGLMFAVATFAAQGLLRRHYRALIARNRRHRLLLRIWLVLYSFVAIQMAWILRPFIGDPAMPTQFFRPGAWGNAYVAIAKTVGEVLGTLLQWLNLT